MAKLALLGGDKRVTQEVCDGNGLQTKDYMMETLEFFDCSCMIGRRGIVHAGSCHSPQDVLERLKRYGIGRALVYHALAREYDAVTGNELLLRQIKGFPELVPVFVVMPHHTGEFPDPDTLVLQMKHSGVKAVRMFPSAAEQNYSLAEWSSGALLAALERHRILLLMDMDQLGWDELHSLLFSYPCLKVVLTNVTYRIDRNLYPLMERHEGLHLEISGYKTHNGIEEVCRRFSAKRLLFGSGMPLYSGGAAVSMIHYAAITEAEKRMIAHGNLDQLLEGGPL